MSSLILQAATRLLQPLLLAFSLVLLVRGHDEPGGGFVGGLTATAAFALNALAYGVPAARRALRVDPRALVGAGLVLVLASGSLALALGRPFLTGIWATVSMPALARVELGSPLLFDLGVYVAVVGAALTIILELGEV